MTGDPTIADPSGQLYVLGDLGSTFTKLLAVDSTGTVLGRSAAHTSRDELDVGFTSAYAELTDAVPAAPEPRRTILSSSAAGGLRLVIVGLEPSLTVRFGRMAASTAGGRIVGAFDVDRFEAFPDDDWRTVAADIVVLTGGTDGGDRAALPRAAAKLHALPGDPPVVVAGNQEVYSVCRSQLDGVATVKYVANVMPRIGQLEFAPVRTAIRDVFIEHVMGRGRFASASSLVGLVTMPTPDAVLSAAEQLAALGEDVAAFASPVIVDVGGATTDIHSVLNQVRYESPGVGFGAGPRRTVEADLGMRESASALLDAAEEAGWVPPATEPVASAVAERVRDRSFVSVTDDEWSIDRELAILATGLGLARHAGELRVEPDDGGLRVVRTGRDLSRASVVVTTGGIFHHLEDPEAAVREALGRASEAGALMPPAEVDVVVDRDYVLWAAGLLATCDETAARGLLRKELIGSVGGSTR